MIPQADLITCLILVASGQSRSTLYFVKYPDDPLGIGLTQLCKLEGPICLPSHLYQLAAPFLAGPSGMATLGGPRRSAEAGFVM